MDGTKPKMALESWDDWLKGEISKMTASEAANFAREARALAAMMKPVCRPWCVLAHGHDGHCAWTTDKAEARRVWEEIKARMATKEST